MKGIIYIYTFSDGKVYIGQTRRLPEKRKCEHFDEFLGPLNSGFWEAYKRLGTPEYSELLQIERENVDDLVAELNEAETFFIQMFQADNPMYGYNKRSFGTVATNTHKIIEKRYKEYLDRILKVRMRGYTNATNKLWLTKEPLTDEEKYLLKEKYREKNIWQDKVDKYDFDNIANNSEENTLLMVEGFLDSVRFGIINDAKEEAIKYITDNYDKILQEERSKNAIVQLDEDGNVVKEFYSFNEICHAFNVLRAENVKNVLRGKQKTAYGYYWKYKKDLC